MKLSLLLIVCNEEARLRAGTAIDSCRAVVDEVVVVVQDSTDATLELARESADVVVTDRCHGLSEPSRPLGLSHCSGDWILALDADEALTPWAAERIREWCENEGADFYRLRILTTAGDSQLEDAPHGRLFRRGKVKATLGIHQDWQPADGARAVTLPEAVTIRHAKTWAEQHADDARYASQQPD